MLAKKRDGNRDFQIKKYPIGEMGRGGEGEMGRWGDGERGGGGEGEMGR
ncbi:MAG: hypothetical protein F6K58_21610 [Symploca sp. SIO2E9]|nr:hypothetical protein [Symploca sp. SIO2E9]